MIDNNRFNYDEFEQNDQEPSVVGNLINFNTSGTAFMEKKFTGISDAVILDGSNDLMRARR